MTNNRPILPPVFEDDGFSVTAVEPWFKVKVQLIERYIQSFITHAASRADEIVLIDLYSGSGLYSVGYQRQIFPGASLASLASNLPISRWVFCEANLEHAAALKVRINRYFRSKNTLIFEQPQDELIDRLRYYIPQSKGSHKVAVLCLADPFSLDLPFETVEKLASLGFNFLIPYTLALNTRMDFNYYLKDQPARLKRFLGNSYGQERLNAVDSNALFYKRLVNVHQNNMLVLGLNPALSVHKLESDWMDVPHYYIGYYGKQISPKVVAHDVKTAAAPQMKLFQSTT